MIRKRVASFTVLVAGFAAIGCNPEPSGHTELTLPLRFHLLTSAVAPDLDSSLTDAEVRDLLTEVNRIWEKAGIRWELESIVREVASSDGEYQAVTTGDGARPDHVRPVMLKVCPHEQWLAPGWNVCVIRRFPFPTGGVYLHERRAVSWPELTRGRFEPNMLAHELGHALCLRHSSETPHNLMQAKPAPRGDGRSGPPDGYPGNAVELSPVQITTARRQAASGQPAGSLDDCP